VMTLFGEKGDEGLAANLVLWNAGVSSCAMTS